MKNLPSNAKDESVASSQPLGLSRRSSWIRCVRSRVDILRGGTLGGSVDAQVLHCNWDTSRGVVVPNMIDKTCIQRSKSSPPSIREGEVHRNIHSGFEVQAFPILHIQHGSGMRRAFRAVLSIFRRSARSLESLVSFRYRHHAY